MNLIKRKHTQQKEHVVRFLLSFSPLVRFMLPFHYIPLHYKRTKEEKEKKEEPHNSSTSCCWFILCLCPLVSLCICSFVMKWSGSTKRTNAKRKSKEQRRGSFSFFLSLDSRIPLHSFVIKWKEEKENNHRISPSFLPLSFCSLHASFSFIISEQKRKGRRKREGRKLCSSWTACLINNKI